MSKYLLEIGVEELPYVIIPTFISQLKTNFEKLFSELNIEYKDVNVLATPRRLAVIIDGLSEKQEDVEKVLRGPIKNVAYDEAGNLTKAGEGFLKKNGVDPKDAYLQDNYLHAKVLLKGKMTEDVLKENVPNLILKLQGSHFMRWANHSEKFSRPIRWIVSILDEKPIEIQIIDVKSSNITRGHRFSNQHVVINHPDEYIQKLKEAYVYVNQNERKDLIVKMAHEEASKLGVEPYYNDDLLEEVTYLCEYPKAVVCYFDEKYLELPEEVPITVMAHHQRYFALKKNGKLTNQFITITNFIGDDFENIKAGNLRVVRARLDDGVFFFKEDLKKPLEAYVEGLKGMTFQKGLGSVYDKTQRLVKLSENIAKELGADVEKSKRCALLCKADLVTSLVYEFTELQGFIGADYAKHANEAPEVCLGIKEHYFPINADSELATSTVGQVVGIADKIDTICAVFVDGKKPTGSSDPLGVRRAALGIIKTVINKDLKLNIENLIAETLKLLPIQKDCADEVNEFFKQRLSIYLADTYKKDAIEACLSVKNPLSDLTDFMHRLNAVTNTDLKPVLESANRVIRILKTPVYAEVKSDLFKDESESMLYEKINSVSDTEDYNKYLQEVIALTPYVEKFFDNVLVMDNDENVKNNRLAMLTELKEKYEKVADFSKFQ